MATISSVVKRSKLKPRHAEDGVIRVASRKDAAKILDLLRHPPKPTKALIELMKGK